MTSNEQPQKKLEVNEEVLWHLIRNLLFSVIIIGSSFLFVLPTITITTYAAHEDKWITIEVSVVNVTRPDNEYDVYVGIPKAQSSMNVLADDVIGYDLQTYYYEFDFRNIHPNTPFEVCVEEQYIDEFEFKWSCKSSKTSEDVHTFVEISAPK